MKNTSSATTQKRKVDRKKGIVTLPLKEYEELRQRAVPTYYLSGKAARDLDNLVDEGLREYKAGKAKTIRSLADLD